jgi:hypothetical protein
MDDNMELELEFELELLDPKPVWENDMVSCIGNLHCSGLCGSCTCCSA